MSTPSRSRRLGVALLTPLVLLLSACGAQISFTIHDDDTFELTMLVWDDTGSGTLTKDTCTESAMGGSSGFPSGTKPTYTFTDHNGDPACRISARGIPVSEFSGSNNSMSITHNDRKFDVTVPSGDASAKALYDDSDSSYSVTFPGKVTDADGGKVEGNKVTFADFEAHTVKGKDDEGE